jgi:hypothetical protein
VSTLGTSVTIPEGQHKKAVKLLFVTWMFGVSWLFERLTIDLMEDITAPLEDFDLPISSVALSINQYNQQFVYCDVVDHNVCFALWASIKQRDSRDLFTDDILELVATPTPRRCR